MIMLVGHSKHWTCLALALLCSITDPASVEARLCRDSHCCNHRTCPTIHRAGEEDGQLQVHISGETFNAIEAFYHHNYFIDEIVHEANVHCCAQVLLASPDKHGTFAIRYGARANQFVAYGVFNDQKLVKVTNDPRQVSENSSLVKGVDSRYPIKLIWISSQVLKIGHGRSANQTLILKFGGTDGDGYWTVLKGEKAVPSATAVHPDPQ